MVKHYYYFTHFTCEHRGIPILFLNCFYCRLQSNRNTTANFILQDANYCNSVAGPSLNSLFPRQRISIYQPISFILFLKIKHVYIYVYIYISASYLTEEPYLLPKNMHSKSTCIGNCTTLLKRSYRKYLGKLTTSHCNTALTFFSPDEPNAGFRNMAYSSYAKSLLFQQCIMIS